MKAWYIRPAIAAFITGLVLFSQRMKKKIVKNKDLTPGLLDWVLRAFFRSGFVWL
jgi:hypothetical protein